MQINVLALFHFEKLLTVGVGVYNCAWVLTCFTGQTAVLLYIHPQIKLSTVTCAGVVVTFLFFTFFIVLNSCTLNCFVFSMQAKSICSFLY